MLRQSIAGVLCARNLFQPQSLFIVHLLYPERLGLDMPQFAQTPSLGYAQRSRGIRVDDRLESKAEVRRVRRQAQSLSAGRDEGVQLGLRAAQRDRALLSGV